MRPANRHLSLCPCPRGLDRNARLGEAITLGVEMRPLTELGGELATPVEPVGGVLGQRF